MLDAQRRDMSLRHEAELEFLEAEGDARTKRLVLGGVCARWARRSRAGAFVFWRENRRALEATKSRSLTLLPRLVYSLSMRCERRQLTKALRQMRRNALDIRRRQINASQGIRKLRRRLAIWVRQRSHSALQTWRENAHDKQWRLALACGRVYQCMRRRSRWRRRAAWRIWRERVKDGPRACQLIGRLLHRSAVSRLMTVWNQPVSWVIRTSTPSSHRSKGATCRVDAVGRLWNQPVSWVIRTSTPLSHRSKGATCRDAVGRLKFHFHAG